jgi:hypothetical protein
VVGLCGFVTVNDDELVAKRIGRVQDICSTAIEHERARETGRWTDRHWLAQSVLNVLEGNIDYQFVTD